jgi:hypothetical protein
LHSETIDGYKIKYSYLKKDDPLSSNNRKVTDISMCISIPFKFPTFKVVGTIVLLLGGYMATQLDLSTISKEDTKPISKINEKVVSKIIHTKKVEKKKFYICNEPYDKIVFKDKDMTSCFQDYINKYCNKKTILSSSKWLENENDTALECIGIKLFDVKQIDFSNAKTNNKKKIINFIKGQK